jgi:hypothetical protein
VGWRYFPQSGRSSGDTRLDGIEFQHAASMPSGSGTGGARVAEARFLRQGDGLPGPESATVGAAARSALQQSGDTA